MFKTRSSDPTQASGAVIGGIAGVLFVFLALVAATKLLPPPQLEGTARITQDEHVVTPLLRADRS